MSNISEPIDYRSSLKNALLALREMRSKLDAIERSKTEPIAIVGMGCRFPGGINNPHTFWSLLHNGVDAITEVPPARWDINEFYNPDPDVPGKMYARCAGFLEQVDQFDAKFFGIVPREAVSMDPQQRLLLEVSWEALEYAGQAPDRLRNSQTGVFIGITTNDYLQLQTRLSDRTCIDAYTATGNCLNAVAGRLSYTLGLQGPSMVVDTACSSSLVSIHLACQSLRNQECNLALAGGVNLILSPDGSIATCRARMLARDGRCKTFDAAADGFARGEGCGVVVLKRLSHAIADGDNILALIRGSAVNQDGPSSGLTVPNGPAQQALIRKALASAGVEPEQVSYVEAHGTGTSLGDPIEVESLAAVLCQGRSMEHPLSVGSLKTNIGHLESAAGVAGLIKLVLALQHKEIPPHLHLKNPNPYIPWSQLPIKIPTEPIPWPSTNGSRIAGLSGFGVSGTNAHLVVEEAPAREPMAATVERPLHLLTLSAKSENALQQLASRLERHLATYPSLFLTDVCFTANIGRSQFAHRLALVAESSEQVCQQLAAVQTGNSPVGVFAGQVRDSDRSKVAFVFTGQGSQYLGMGRQLYDTQPTFREALERCDTILRPYLEQPLLSVLYPAEGENSPLDRTAYTQPALFALEYALYELWRSWGIQPDAVLGHSVGEYVAACVAGVFSLEDGLKLIAERSRLMQALPPGGEMAAVFATEAQVVEAVTPYADQVAIAGINSPQNVVISGEREAVQAVIQKLEAQGIETRPLRVSHAFHSPLMEPMLAAFEQQAAEVNYTEPQIDLISSVTGQLIEGTEVGRAGYWCRQVREPVRFAAGMQTLQALGYELFVEIGPDPVLLGMGRQCLPEGVGVWLPSLRQGQDDWQQLLQSLAALSVQGVAVDWSGFDRDYQRQLVPLPTYPFERQRFWFETKEVETGNQHKQAQVHKPETPAPSVCEMNLEQRILALVAKTTGINQDQLGLDMSLEAELGLDSIMMTQLANGLLKLIPEEQQAAFSSKFSLRNLMQLQTLREMIQVLEKWQASEGQDPVNRKESTEKPVVVKPEIGLPQEHKTENVELLHGQYFHLIGYWLVNSSSLFASLRLEGAFDLDIAWQSWNDLVSRHPMLRSRFRIPTGATSFKDYQLEVLEDPTPPEIPITDIRHLDEDERERVVAEEIHRWLNYEWQLTQWPLHQFSVLRLEDSVYQLFLGNEHLISDGLGNHIILREFMELYRARICNEQPNLPPPTTLNDYSKLVAAMNAWHDVEEDRALAEYTNSQGKISYFWNPKGATVNYPRPQFYTQKYLLGRDTTAKLIAKTREWRLPVNSLLLGAFLRAVVKFEQSSQVAIVQVPTSGRVYPGADASNVVSSFAQNLALSFALPQPEEDWQVLLNRIHQEIQNGIATGLDRAQTRQMGKIFRENIVLEDGKIPEHSLSMFQSVLKSNLYFPYTGHTHINNHYASVKVTAYQAGGINAPGTLDILQEIFDGCLHLFASYDYNFFELSLIDNLMREYINQIEELVSLPIQPHQVSKQQQALVGDTNIESALRQVAEEICHFPITANEMDKDLEADLGVDSLERIRIVTHLEKLYGKVNRQTLLSCRSLQEMASILNQSKKQVTQLQQASLADTRIESTLQQIAEEICHFSITSDEMDKDLEADLGVDSLERIRIVTRLEKLHGKVDRQALLNCRSLQEMASTLSKIEKQIAL
ncbi:acyltransferase domain-containing protein [Cyanobacteria bacterium FACHB-472]|nr:acyltransferase domain-containing protein [Cyanobacteria bacterium FACHB-472]